MKVELKLKNEVLMVAHPADVKEKVQDLFADKYGIYPDLQENCEEGLEEGEDYYIYLHSDAVEDLTDSEYKMLEELRITEDPEDTTEALKEILEIDFRVVA